MNWICDGKDKKSRNCNFSSEEKCDMIYSEEVALRVKGNLQESLKEIFGKSGDISNQNG